MMTRTKIASLAAVMLLGLWGCAEKEQVAQTRKSDSPAWAKTDNEFVAAGWKPGDKASWEEQLKARAQAQNDYAKVK